MNRFSPSEQKDGQPVPYLSPEGIDAPIESLRAGFHQGLNWLDRSFGRVYDQYRDDQRGKYIFPCVWQGKSVDLLDVLENDNVNSICYFRALDPETPFGEYEDNEEADNQLQRKVQIVFSFTDIENLPGFEVLNHRYIDTLKNEVRTYLKSHQFPKGINWEFVKSYDEPKNVLKGYTFDLFKDRLTEHPCLIFVIEIKFTYFELGNFC